MSLARAALALAVVAAMLWTAGCGRKAMPEPRRSAGPASATLIGSR